MKACSIYSSGLSTSAGALNARSRRSKQMVVVMQEMASEEQIQNVIDRLIQIGFDVHRSTGSSHTVLGAVGGAQVVDPRDIELLDGVREVVKISASYKLASRA